MLVCRVQCSVRQFATDVFGMPYHLTSSLATPHPTPPQARMLRCRRHMEFNEIDEALMEVDAAVADAEVGREGGD